MNVNIRTEIQADYPVVSYLVEESFRAGDMPYADEALLVERLRRTDAFIPELSIVAEIDREVVGHIMLTKTKIRNGEESFDSLAMAPVAVKPAFQKNGIGAKLILEAHRVAKELGWTNINLVGHPGYYPRFGYKPTSTFGISFPFEAPKDACMIIELIPGSLDGISGAIEYHKTFFE